MKITFRKEKAPLTKDGWRHVIALTEKPPSAIKMRRLITESGSIVFVMSMTDDDARQLAKRLGDELSKEYGRFRHGDTMPCSHCGDPVLWGWAQHARGLLAFDPRPKMSGTYAIEEIATGGAQVRSILNATYVKVNDRVGPLYQPHGSRCRFDLGAATAK